MTRKILLQCQSVTYFYNGLGSIYTKYPNEELEIDVLLTNNNTLIADFTGKIKKSKYVHNIFPYNYQPLAKINKKMDKNKKNIFNQFLFDFYYKPKICKIWKNITNCDYYSDIVYSQETKSNLITYLKMAYPEANFIIYGDGSGGLLGANSYVDVPFVYKFFKEIKPDEIIAMAPMIEDNSFDVTDIPVASVDKEKFLNIITEDTKIQEEINSFANEILDKYSNCENKVLLLTSQLEDEKYSMSNADQLNIYLDMIDEYCEDNTLLILKLHPAGNKNIVKDIKSNIRKNCEIVTVPETLKAYPVEIYYKLMQNLDFVITFLSSSAISLSFLYGIKTIDAYDIVQKYPIKVRITPILNTFKEIIQRLETWDKKSLIYSYNIIPTIEKYNKQNGKTTNNKKTNIKLNFFQKIFSVKNIYSDYGKKKQIVILGIKIKF